MDLTLSGMDSEAGKHRHLNARISISPRKRDGRGKEAGPGVHIRRAYVITRDGEIKNALPTTLWKETKTSEEPHQLHHNR